MPRTATSKRKSSRANGAATAKRVGGGRGRGVAARGKIATRGAKRGRRGAVSRAGEKLVRWSPQDDRELRALVRKSIPAREMSERLGRTESAVRQHAHKLGLSLRSGR